MIGITLKDTILFVILLPIWLFIRIFRYLIYKKKGINLSIMKELLMNLFFIYILYMASITIFPLDIMFERTNDIKPVANFIPIAGKVNNLAYISKSPVSFTMLKHLSRTLIGNGILLFPVSIFLPLLWEKFRNVKTTVLFCFCITLSIGCFQYISAYWGSFKAFDIDDIILNTISALIGYIFYDKVLKKTRVVRTLLSID